MQHNKVPHPEDHRRMVLFFLITALIMTLSYMFITRPNIERARVEAAAVAATAAPQVAAASAGAKDYITVDQALGQSAKRVTLETGKVKGSLAVTGLRIDDVLLKDYYTTLEKTDRVRLLAPSMTKDSNFVEVGMIADGVKVPDNDTQWHVVSGEALTPQTPVVLEWDNGQGLMFRRTLSVDDAYVVTVEQSVKNNGSTEVALYPYALISESHPTLAKGEKVPFDKQVSSVQHMGPLAYVNDELQEEAYGDMRDKKNIEYKDAKGWLGMTSKYWLVALLPSADETFDARFAYQTGAAGQDIFQADMRGSKLVIPAAGEARTQMRIFTGVKKLSVLNGYSETLQVPKLDLAVDFGVLYFLTKPLYHLLSFLGNFFESQFPLQVSFGVALLVLTVIVRAATFPLQNKAYRSMNAMKDLAPKLHELKEKYGDDKAKFQQEVMGLYKREKVNPASGCLPILIQIPIFFALYKVIYITLDMRQAPFWGWIHDLSAPDPTNVFNLFGLLPFHPPAFLAIGAWPLLYGLTMWIQQALNPKPEDPMQQQVFAMLPWVFTFIFAQFPAGLVIYYTWSNILGIVQQYSLRKMHK